MKLHHVLFKKGPSQLVRLVQVVQLVKTASHYSEGQVNSGPSQLVRLVQLHLI